MGGLQRPHEHGVYLVAFDEVGTDPFGWLDIGEGYRRRGNRSMFTPAANIDYLAEMFEGDSDRIVTWLIGRGPQATPLLPHRVQATG